MKTKGMSQQIAALEASLGKRNFAYFMEQGTGKTWTTLADAERAFKAGKIDGIIVWAPKGVHQNWILREIPTHLEVPYVAFAWNGPVKTKRQKEGVAKLTQCATRFKVPTLRVFTINFEAMLRPQAREFVDAFIADYRVLAVVDESKKIGNPDTKRTKYIIESGRKAEARRILSGKPLTKAPMDLYSQFDFLKSGLLGTKSYRAFVAEFAVLLDPRSFKMQAMIRKNPRAAFAQVVDEDEAGNKMYRNLDKLRALIAPHSFRVRKDECLDLPPKQYKQVRFDLNDEQRDIYETLEKEKEYVSKEHGPQSFQAIAARAKMKQVTSGFVNVHGEPEYLTPERNPRMEAFLDIVDDIPDDASFIVWAIYRDEIRQIVEQLNALGIATVEYHGGVSDKPRKEDGRSDRDDAIDTFQSRQARAFVCNKAAYAGLTLTAATYSLYYSCDFDNDIRGQSEDRCHRIGTTGSVLYIDFIARETLDEDIAQSLAFKDAIADHVIDGRPMTT